MQSFDSTSIISEVIWTAHAKRHSELTSPLGDAYLKRRSLGQTHPVYDFLFTYYSCSPLKLRQWIPSFEQALEIGNQSRKDFPWLNEYWFKQEKNILTLDHASIKENAKSLAGFVAELCQNISSRPPRFSCFGLHEWAMVYKLSPSQVRHQKQRLRLSPDEITTFVDSQTITCSHYDAYRFFTPEAKPLNLLNPTLDSRLSLEQGGCIHANMDLYKWSLKLWPWIGSDLLAKAFFLAVEGRELDMRASPYDLREEGFNPIFIETKEGRQIYQKEQQIYAEKSAELRLELGAFCKRFSNLRGLLS